MAVATGVYFPPVSILSPNQYIYIYSGGSTRYVRVVSPLPLAPFSRPVPSDIAITAMCLHDSMLLVRPYTRTHIYIYTNTYTAFTWLKYSLRNKTVEIGQRGAIKTGFIYEKIQRRDDGGVCVLWCGCDGGVGGVGQKSQTRVSTSAGPGVMRISLLIDRVLMRFFPSTSAFGLKRRGAGNSASEKRLNDYRYYF